MEKICKLCGLIFITNFNRVFCCSKECINIYKNTEEFKKQKYEYDKIRRSTSKKWKETHTKYYKDNAKEIYKRKKENYFINLSEEKLEKHKQDKLKYSKSLKGKLHQKNNFAIRWINKKYIGRRIDNITYKQLLEKYNETNGICVICKKELINFDMDHKISLNNGGEHTLDNIHFICHICNMKKGSKNYLI